RDRLNLEVMVVNTYLAVLQINPRHPQALAALAARYEAQGRWSDLIGILSRQADIAATEPERVALHRRIAMLWMDKLSKPQNAVLSLEKILDVDPKDADARARLRDIYTRGRTWRALVDLTRREAPLLPPSERRERLAESARVASERLGDVKDAINLWNMVLAIDGSDADALSALVALYDRERRWPALAEMLERQRLGAQKDSAAEAALLERRGVLLYEKLGAAEAAIAVFQRVQTLQPQNARAIRALREIYAQAGDFEALELLFAGQGNYDDLCETLTALADRTPDPKARTRMLGRVAVLALEKLRQPERALKAYERILATEPTNVEAAQALVPLYRASQKWPRLLATYEVLLGKATDHRGDTPVAPSHLDVDARLTILKEGRQIAEQRMGSKGLAFQWASRAFEVAPNDESTLVDLERLAGESDEWSVVAALYGKRLNALGGSAPGELPERRALLRRSMRVASAKLHRPTDARALADALLVEDPTDEEAQSTLEQILTQTQAWPDLAILLHGRANRTVDVAERSKLLFRIAQLEEEKSGDLGAAARTYSEIADLDPASETALRALRALAKILDARQDWAGLVQALRRELALRAPQTRDDAKTQGQVQAQVHADVREDLLLRIGDIEQNRIGNLDAAFATYRDVLMANPLSAAAVAGLERLAGRAPGREVDIASLVLPYYQRTDNAPKLAAALEILAGVAKTAEEKIQIIERLVSLYAGPLKNPGGAYRAALQIFELNPGNRTNREMLARFAGDAEVGAVPELAERLRAVAGATTDAALRRDLLVEVAELLEQRLGSAQAAETVYREILAAEPLHAGAFRALGRLYRDSERWKDLQGLLDARQGRVVDVSERIDLLAQIAEVDETVLDDSDHAIVSYEKMLELDPADPRAYKALDRHYAALERWRDRDQLLERRLHFAAEGEVSELEFRRAELRFHKFDDIDGAIDILISIVRLNPGHEGARQLLETALGSPAHRRRAAEILVPLYEAGQSWKQLVTALGIDREGREGADAAVLLARIATLHESRLNDLPAAFASWREVLASDPTHKTALVEVERLAATLERWNNLVDVYQELAFRRDGADLLGRADLLSRAALLYAGKIGNRRAAIDAWKMVLNLDPENPATAKPAADALQALYGETGNVDALVKILRMQVAWSDTLDARRTLLFRIAELEETALADTDA
ncbi:MAG: hypothetical protein H7X95_00950, partial [Deltaproteobacteria bacterium]|nr:hypothetical protein [Deltaproteobacteria bacterium]